ncbi:NAD(P)-dependent oxidoreductase [Brenneria tiliae]|uniref:NAD(P)-dependent oxidoreductase n=1 Tax=Brenneria tiliae TaxID=2914984 RepID=UPI002014D4EA|nr:NAD(P)-dependent oxidoreductase [Brenneria tiliae]MCL2899882.1 bifunctional glyoxylate/hydroxypyruvate reductase B [Brenneria tiliae]MCL2904629.1 bifunctional glyoxylate/hydroxypyruvate reductase B [Brenneria tiliae]
MKPHVVLYKNIPADQMARLQEHCNLTFFDGVTADNRDDFIRALAQAEGLIGASHPIAAAYLDRAPQLRAISTISVGVDQFSVPDLTERGIYLMHTPGVLTETTADTIFLLVLNSARRAIEMAELVKQGRWTRSIGADCYGTDVNGKTIGILGMGRIGYAVAKRAHDGFGMSVLYYNDVAHPQAEQTLHARRRDLDELLAQSDFVCVVLPLLPETTKFIGKEQLRKMKSSAFLINGSRGKIVDQAALIEALRQGVIRGAGLDVFEQEPLPADSPLLSLPNVVALPHIGSATHETRYAMVRCAVDNLFAALQGDVAQNCVNPTARVGG